MDETLITEAIFLADGADIHDVAAMVAIYRSLTREERDASELERELRRYVGRRRMERLRQLTAV